MNIINGIYISKDWVQKNLVESIFLNDQLSPPAISAFRTVPKKYIARTLPLALPLTPPPGTEIAKRILNLMLCKSVRRGSKSLILPYYANIKEKIEIMVAHNQPISFVLPSLPFKDQSPFGTGAPIDHADLGEYAFFAQIKRILSGIEAIYPPGAHMTILCDGYIYADIFTENDTDGAGRYKARCEHIKNAYGLYNTVTLFDMREVFFDIPYWKEIESGMELVVRDLYQINTEAMVRIDHLAKRFMYYVQLPGHSYDTARTLYEKSPWPQWVWELLLSSAIRYSAVHLAMKKTNVVMEAFPSAIRCTVHPKAAPQLPLHLTNQNNQLLPYNGVAAVSREALERGATLFQATRIKRLCDILAFDNVTAVHFEGDSYPFYYEIP